MKPLLLLIRLAYGVNLSLKRDWQSDTHLAEERELMSTYANGTMDMDRYMQATLKPIIGMDSKTLTQLVAEFIERKIKPAFYADAISRIQWHKQRGDIVLVISATGEHLVKPIAKLLGADDAIAINLEQIKRHHHRQNNRNTQLSTRKGDKNESMDRRSRHSVQGKLWL